jgi:dTDP-4-amino-4,6-dideoxygalactose transaminase
MNHQKTLHVGQLNFPEQSKLIEKLGTASTLYELSEINDAIRLFEKRIAHILQVKHVFAVSNGTIALMLALKALRVNTEGDEIIVPSFTFVATIQAVIWAGFRPVFCDVDRTTHMLSRETVEPLLTDDTAAVMGVHLWGANACGEDLESFCRERDVPLVFDAAHAFGCFDKGKSLACIGQFACYSFHATKVVNAAEGGAIVTNDDEIAGQIREVMYTDNDNNLNNDEKTDILSSQMSLLQVCIGNLSLDDFEVNVSRNERLQELYKSHLANIDGLEFYDLLLNSSQSNFQYLVLEITNRARFTKYELMEYLRARKILIRDYFSPPIHQLTFASQFTFEEANLKNTDYLSEHLVQLPVGQNINENDVTRVCDSIKAFINEQKNNG